MPVRVLWFHYRLLEAVLFTSPRVIVNRLVYLSWDVNDCNIGFWSWYCEMGTQFVNFCLLLKDWIMNVVLLFLDKLKFCCLIILRKFSFCFLFLFLVLTFPLFFELTYIMTDDDLDSTASALELYVSLDREVFVSSPSPFLCSLFGVANFDNEDTSMHLACLITLCA